MPIYEYECEQCGKTEETFQPMQKLKPKGICSCGGQSKLIISIPQSPKLWTLEYSNALGRYVKDKADYIEGLKKIGADYKQILSVNPY